MNSIWHEKTNKVYPQIDQDMQVQTLVVGGGIAGYMAAYFLAESGHEVVLIEKNTLFSGVTKNTTGFITALQDLVCQEIEKKHVTKIARQYFESQQQGIDIIDTLVKKHAIDCDFVRLPTYLFARGGLASLKAEFAALKRIGAPVQWQRQLPALSLQTTGVIKLDNQAQFHPIKFLRGLPQNFAVYENSKVTDADFVSKTVFVGKHKIVAQNIVMATHYPIFNYPELFFARMYQSQSYCLAYKTQVDLQGMYVEDIANGLTFRNQNQHLIVGGFDHRVGRVQKYNPMERLQRTASQTGHENSTHQWYAQDCVSFDYLPFAGQIKDREGCFVITGFNKWGMANSAICTQLVCDLVNKKQNAFEKLFSPGRITAAISPKKAASHGCVTIKQLLANLLLPFKNFRRLQPNSGGVFLVEGKKTGVFKDENGQYHFVTPSCSHLGCSLSFNRHTQTFDCACHGSRFSTKGQVLSEPAVEPIHTTRKV